MRKKTNNQNNKDLLLNSREIKNNPVVFTSILNKDFSQLEELLQDKENLSVVNEELHTPIEYSINVGNLQAAIMLIREQANVNSKNKNGLSPLHILIRRLDSYLEQDITSEEIIELVKQLITNGAKPNVQDRRGNSIINCIAQKAKINKPYTNLYNRIGKMILSYDKDVSQTVQIKNNMGKTPLDYLSRNGNTILRDVVYELLPQNQEKMARIIEEGERAIKKALSMSKEEEVA
jgi:ankyrin repeat protein